MPEPNTLTGDYVKENINRDTFFFIEIPETPENQLYS